MPGVSNRAYGFVSVGLAALLCLSSASCASSPSADRSLRDLDRLVLGPLADAEVGATVVDRQVLQNCRSGVPSDSTWVLRATIRVESSPDEVAAVLRDSFALVEDDGDAGWSLLQRAEEPLGWEGGVTRDDSDGEASVIGLIDVVSPDDGLPTEWLRDCSPDS